MQMNIVTYVRELVQKNLDVTLLPGMDVNAVDTHGWTPLMQAAIANDGELTRALLNVGASHQVRNQHGFSAMMWARWCESVDFVTVLKELRGDNAMALDTTDQEGLERLMKIRDEAKGKNPSVLSVLETSGYRLERTRINRADVMNHAGSSFELKQIDESGPQKSDYHVEEKDVPIMSLEEFIRHLGTGSTDTQFPGGHWEGDIDGFLNSCKLFVQNLIASRKTPTSVGPLDMFALHVYTRSDCSYFSVMNKALRSNDPQEISFWKPFTWSISMALNRLRGESGVYFRGVRNLFTHVEKKKFLAGEVIPWGAFTSSSRDHRVAANFMYGNAAQDVAGVVFKIWGTAPVSLELFSFFPQEQEYLFAPNSLFKVLNWYEATDVNLRRGVSLAGKSQDFVIDADHIVQAVPLQRVFTDEDLERQLSHNRVVLIEVKQVFEMNSADESYEESSTAML